MAAWHQQPWQTYAQQELERQANRRLPPSRAALARRTAATVALALVGMALPLVVLTTCGTPAYAADQIPRAALQHRGTLKREAQRVWGLNAPVASFAAQIHQESRWRHDARSPVGAIGMAQFMPATAKWIGGMDRELATRDPMNPAWAVRALVVYDKWLWDRVTAVDACNRMAFAMAAYNGGLGWTNKRKARSPQPGICFGATCAINPGIHPANQRENQHYPEVILKRYEPLYANTIGWGPGVCQ